MAIYTKTVNTFNKYLSFTVSAIIIVLIFLSASINLNAQSNNGNEWVGTWSAAPYAAANNTPPSPYLANNTLRQIVRVSIGGDTLRVKFSNITSSTPATINSVNIAVSLDRGNSLIDTSTMKQLKFNGNDSVTMDPYSEVFSDPLAFPLAANTVLAITIYYGQIKTAADMTFHYGSRTDSYLLTGDQTTSADFAGAAAVERWYTISSIDVLAHDEAASIAVLGNSITDGYGIHGGSDKWTDTFSKKLLDNPSTSHVGVLNLGIGATLATTSGVSRFQHDILEQSGLRWIIVFYGVNDINANVSADKIINAFQGMIAQAHANNIRIYGATITPFKGHSYFTTTHEAVRGEVNEWIRTPGNFDKYIDFDKAIRDPADTLKLLAEYSNDWLHPNAAGYKFLGESVDLNLFLGTDTLYEQTNYESIYYEPECADVGSNWEVLSDAAASNEKYVTVKAGTQSLDNPPVGDENLIHIPFSVDSTGNYSVYARLNCPSPNDDSFWVKIDDGDFQLNNGLGTSGWGWIKFDEDNFTKGDHTLTIGYREDGAKMDKICISNSPFPPIGIGDEAENICAATEVGSLNELPDGFYLEQNYPNPFNPETTIKYSIPGTGNVSLKVFDVLGNEIAILVEGIKPAGNYSINFNGSKLSSGVYIYKLRSGNFIDTKKLVLLK